MKQPMVTVIIPCYNAEKTIGKTVHSVLNQTYRNYEIVIVNDGSLDKSMEVINDLIDKDRRISLISIINQGVSKARNTGINHAKGEYIAFLDADDLWYPDKLEKQVEYMNNQSDVGVCFSRVEFISETGESLNQYSNVPAEGLDATGLLNENLTCTTSNIICRKRVINEVGTFNTTMSFSEDQEWLLRVVLLSSWKIIGLQDIHVCYRTNPGSLSSQLSRMEQGWELLVEQVRHYAPEFIAQHYKCAKAINYRYLARRSLRQGDTPLVGLKYMLRVWRYDKWLYFNQPKRTIATLVCLLLMQLLSTDVMLLKKI